MENLLNNSNPFSIALKNKEKEFKREVMIKRKICSIFEKDVGIVDDGRGVFAAMIQFIYECMDNENFYEEDFENKDIKENVNKAIMKILLLDKEKTGSDPDDFTMMCRNISKSLSNSPSDQSMIRQESDTLKDEQEICDKINLSFL